VLSDLAELNLEVAKRAWNKAALAADPKSQLRSVIADLETAAVEDERSLNLKCANMDLGLSYRSASSRADTYGVVKVNLLMAACYFCVEHRPLAIKALADAPRACEMGDNSWCLNYLPRSDVSLARAVKAR
jgi:hypothetical protein